MGKGKKVWVVGLLCVFVVGFGVLCGCEKAGSAEGGSGVEAQGGVSTGAKGNAKGNSKGKDLPEDTPWNHGFMAIMETENAYYSNQSGMNGGGDHVVQALRYHDKASGETILLCNKPECSHNGGDACEATYQDILPINCLLYQGSIYELGVEKSDTNVAINLYRAALDGSAIDKVGCVISGDNVKGDEIYLKSASANVYNGLNQRPDYSFIIHQGVAYIPYYLQFGKGMMGLCGAGLLRMDLKTGETEQIYVVESLTAGTPCNVTAVGDYVYFLLSTTNGNGKTKRYNVATKEVESIQFRYSDAEGNVKEIDYPATLYTKDHYFTIAKNSAEGTVSLTAYDARTKERASDADISVKAGEGTSLKAAFFYDGKLFIGEQEKAYFSDLEGNVLAQVDAPQELVGKELSGKSASSYFMDYKISNGKLYFLFFDTNEDVEWQWPEGTIEGEDSLVGSSFTAMQVFSKYHVYGCPLEDVFQGNAIWTELYTTQGR
ncbi:MAG: hypothetical protein J6Z22_09880 [Lachnospiraceae bacterium]|nr:hypothetical protein [Lachnospiraceae bacterium]